MGNPAVLKAALEKAKANGWAYKHELDRLHIEYLLTYNGGVYLPIIFDHNFAKALWGTTEHDANGYENNMFVCTTCHVVAGEQGSSEYCWQYYLQQLVIADNKLEYLGANT